MMDCHEIAADAFRKSPAARTPETDKAMHDAMASPEGLRWAGTDCWMHTVEHACGHSDFYPFYEPSQPAREAEVRLNGAARCPECRRPAPPPPLDILIPKSNWHIALANTVKTAAPGTTIIVDTEAKAELGKRAATRMGRDDLQFRIAARDAARAGEAPDA